MTNRKITVASVSTQRVTQLSVFTLQSLEVKNRRGGGGAHSLKQKPAQDRDSRIESPDWILQLRDNHFSKSDLLTSK